MAREIVIRIISEDDMVPRPVVEESSGPEASSEAKSSSAKKKKSTLSVLGAFVGKRVWAIVKAQAQSSMDKYLSATENYRLQAHVDNTIDTIDSIVSFWFSGVVGYKMFAGTAIGGPAGAVIGIATTAASKTLQAFRSNESKQQLLVENAYSNYFYKERAGYVTGGHGTEN